MIEKNKFLSIKEKYGKVCSFAIWKRDVAKTTKPTIQSWDMSSFVNPDLSLFKTNVVILGLNVSKQLVSMDPNYNDAAFVNFHSGVRDYRLMKALFQLPDYYGSYMTDIYKYFTNKSAKEVIDYFEANPKEEEKQFNAFEEEINFVCGPEKPLFILCGNDVKKAFSRFNNNNKYNSIIIPHYSSNGGVTKKIIEILCDKKGC